MGMKSLLKGALSSTNGIKRLWPLLLPLLLFLPGLDGFPYASPEALFSDVAISHYPNALYLRRAIMEWGVIPLWSPSILSGYPFAANPLSGLWYPPGWLALIFPLPLGFNLMVMAHLLLGGVGLYRFLKIKGISYEGALFGALAFESMPKFFAQYGAGHLTLVYTVCWTPWLLVYCVESSKLQAKRVSLLKPGIILALIFLADPRWAPYAGLLWLLYAIAHRQLSNDINSVEAKTALYDNKIFSNLQYLISNIFISLLLAAPLAIPLLEYTRLSTRSMMTMDDVFAHSLPPVRLLGLIYPDFGGFHEWMLYPGGVVLALLLVAILLSFHRSGVRFWLGVLVISLLYSMGSNLPLLPGLAQIPGFDLLRVPPRALFMAGLAGSILAAYGLNALMGDSKINWRRVSLGLSGLAAFVVIFSLFIGVLTGVWARSFVWGAGSILFASLWVLIQRRELIPRQTWLLILFGMAILDWGAVNASVLSLRSKEAVESEASALGEFLADQTGRFRVYSPSYSLPQDVAAQYGLELADGVEPLQLAAYVDYMNAATGVPRTGYSVTLPPYANGDPATDNMEFLPDANLLGFLNVAYVVAAYELSVEGFALLDQFESVWVYENKRVLSRAWVQAYDADIGQGVHAVEIIEWQPNRISLQADGPGLLVLSEIAYPGWRVKIDVDNAVMQSPLDMLQGVELPPGEHQVTFYFRPLSVYLGLGCFALGVLLFMWVNWERRNKT